MEEGIADIQLTDHVVCAICNLPGNLEGKIRITEKKRQQYLALPDDSLVQVGHRIYATREKCEITYHKKCLLKHLIEEAWGNWGEVDQEHPWVIYCHVCKKNDPKAKSFE